MWPFEGEETRKGSSSPKATQFRVAARSRARCSAPASSLRVLRGVEQGRGGMRFRSTRAPEQLALVATLLVSLHQSDPLGLNATPLPQDSSLVETPPPENKPRKRQLSEEQPSGNGVKKPKVSVRALRTWLVSDQFRQAANRLPARVGLRQAGQEGGPGHSSPGMQCWSLAAKSPDPVPLSLFCSRLKFL